MGYYSELNINVDIKPERVVEFREKVKDYIATHNGDGISWELENMEISDDGCIYLKESYAKWYDCDEYFLFLKGFITDGRIILIGEDNERWGYMIEKDNFFEIEYIEKKGKQIFITELERVMLEATNENQGG